MNASHRRRCLFASTVLALAVTAMLPPVRRDAEGGEVVSLAPVPASRPAWDDDLLERYLELAARPAARQKAVTDLRAALRTWRGGRPAAAATALDRAAERLPGFADWARTLAASAAAESGDTAQVRRQLAAADPTLAREWGWRARVLGRKRAGDIAGALREATQATTQVEDAGRRLAAWKWVAELELAGGDTAAAREAYRTAIGLDPASGTALECAEALSGLRGPAGDDLSAGRVFARHGRTDRALKALDAFLASGAGTAEERASARLEAGRLLFRADRYGAAESRLLGLAGDAPSPEVAASALFLAGRAQYRADRESPARASFARVIERYPATAEAAQALFALGDLEQDDGEVSSARAYFERAATARPASDTARLAAMRLGAMAYSAGRYEEALQVFERSCESLTGSIAQQGCFWAGRTQARLGRSAAARERFTRARQPDPLSYYGLRSAEELGTARERLPLATSPETDGQLAEAVAGAMVRLDVLRELELDDAAAFEMARIKRHFDARPGALYGLAEAFIERGQVFSGIRLGREIYRREGVWNERLLRIVYPFPYERLIKAEARKRGIDPYFVAGLIRQESTFNPRAQSGAGAIGIMQVMPKTGKLIGRRIGVRRYQTARLYEPEVNILIGTLHLSELLGWYGGREAEALAAYNAGAGRVARWRKYPEYQDLELFAERIPFEETREYVRVVQQNARIYRVLYGD